VGHAPKVGQNLFDCSSVCEWDRIFQRCYRYVSFNNLVLAVPKIGHVSKSGTFPECNVVLVSVFTFLFFQSFYSLKYLRVLQLLSVPKMGHMS